MRKSFILALYLKKMEKTLLEQSSKKLNMTAKKNATDIPAQCHQTP